MLKATLNYYSLFLIYLKVLLTTPVPNCNWAKLKGRFYPYLYFNTAIDPIFTDLYNQWYKNGVKTIPQNITRLLDPPPPQWVL